MLKIPLYSNKKLLLAFEYGLILGESARDKGIELTPEIVARAEEIIQKEFVKNNSLQLAKDMIPNILAMFEPDLEIDTNNK